jgi:hypothetical protein
MLLITLHILSRTVISPLPTADSPLDADMTEQVYKKSSFSVPMEDTGAVEGGDIYRYLSIPKPPNLAIFNRKDTKKISRRHIHTRFKKHISHHTMVIARVNFAQHTMLPIPSDRPVCYVRILMPYSCAVQLKHLTWLIALFWHQPAASIIHVDI